MKPFCHSPLSAIVLIAATFAGCHGARDKGNLDTLGAVAPTAQQDREELPEFDVTGCSFGPDGRLKTVYFDYDSAALTGSTQSTLAINAERILEVPDVMVQIAGHCDERGTQEYNLALGERRAQSVRNHLRQLGVPGDRLVTISFGEEAPAIAGGGEAAWAINRRCEFMRATLN